MPQLAQAHLHRILVGVDEADFSRGLIRFDINHQKRDRTGLFLLEGEIELALVDGLPESLDPRRNPSRWARGNPIKVEIQKSNGSWVTHPFGNLVILNPPGALNLAEPTLVLEVGCRLAYRNSQTVASVARLASPTRTEFIDTLLEAALIPSWVGEINEYPFAGTLTIASENNAISTAGEVAWSAGYALWQNRDAEVESIPLALNASATPALTFSVLPSTDYVSALLYEPNESEDAISETVIAREIDTKRKPVQNYSEYRVVNEELGSSRAINPSASESQTVLKRTTITDLQTPTRKVQTTVVEMPEGLILGNKAFTMTVESITQEIWEYEQGFEGKLAYSRRVVERAFALALSSFWSQTEVFRTLIPPGQQFPPFRQSGTELITAEITTTSNKYDPVTGVIETQITETLNPAGQFAPDEFAELIQQTPTNVPAGLLTLTTGLRQKVAWKEIRPSEWQKITSTSEPFGSSGRFPPETATPIGDRITYRLTLGNVNSIVEVSNSGQTHPFAPERLPPETTFEEVKPEKKSSTFITAQAPQDTKQREEINVTFCSSIDQLKPLAELENKLIHGRKAGQVFQLPCTDWLIDNARPGQVWHAIEPDGTKIVYWIDTLTFTHDVESSIVSAEGVWLGTIDADTNQLSLPYSIIANFDSGVKWGETVQSFPYSTTTALIEVDTGVKWGNNAQSLILADVGYKWGNSGFVAIQGVSTGWKWGNYYELVTPEPPAGLWAHAWTFESPDSLNDKIGSSHFTLNADGGSNSVSGIYGDGRRVFYNSNNGYLSTSRQTDLNFDGSFVFAFWFRWEGDNAFNFAVGIFDATSSSYYFDPLEFLVWHRKIEGTANVGWRTDSQSYAVDPSLFPNGVTEGDWIHVICEYNGSSDQMTFTLFNATTSDEVIDSDRTCQITAQPTQPFAVLTEWDSRFDGLHFVKGASSLTTGEKQDIRNGEYPF